jgi:hypothetical protein
MIDLVRLIVWTVVDLFRSWAALEAEILTLRQQINVLRRTAPKKQTFSAIDRLIFVCLYRLLPGVRDALAIVKPETVVKCITAPIASGWSGCRVGLTPTGKRRLCTAHTPSRHRPAMQQGILRTAYLYSALLVLELLMQGIETASLKQGNPKH